MASPTVDGPYLRSLTAARLKIKRDVLQQGLTPLLVRLSFNDALTYDSGARTSGATGSIRTKKELEHPGNEGLEAAVKSLADVKNAFPLLTSADIFHLAGIVAVEEAGGPRIGFTPGRKDSWAFPPPGRLLDPTKSSSAVKDFKALAQRTGLSLRALVALTGVHTLARWWPDSQAPYFERYHKAASECRFSNAYFKLLVEGKLAKDGWLLEDEECALLVHEFAANEAAFFQEYALAHEQLTRLGTRLPAAAPGSPLGGESLWGGYTLAELQVAAAAGLVVVGGAFVAYGLWRRRRRQLGL